MKISFASKVNFDGNEPQILICVIREDLRLINLLLSAGFESKQRY
jgi:hypothetical protein